MTLKPKKPGTLKRNDPAGEMVVNRTAGRSIFWGSKADEQPCSMLRRYSISRSDISKALAILEDIKPIMDKDEVIGQSEKLLVLSENMSRLSVNYQLKSLEHLGEVTDTSASSKELQGLIEKPISFQPLRPQVLW